MNRNMIYVLFALALLPVAFAHSASDFTTAQQIIAEHPSCDSLTRDQFALVGDYAMELQHPGQAHEAMDAMMGGEGSASLEAMHVAMGENYLGCAYTNDTAAEAASGYGMMGGQYGMMGYRSAPTADAGYGMMGGYGGDGYARVSPWASLPMIILWILIAAFLVSGSLFFITASRRKRK